MVVDAEAGASQLNLVVVEYAPGGFIKEHDHPFEESYVMLEGNVDVVADGTSYIRETIYDGRYTLVGELTKMGAKVEVDGNVAIVHGPSALRGTKVVAHDLRTGIALILAGLSAEGETVVAPGYLIDRGHAAIASRLSTLGADITAEESA